MIEKHPLRPDRLRQIPDGFSWIDHRLVRQDYIRRCDCESLALYLFLVSVSDIQGLSYYSDRSICRHLKLDTAQLSEARIGLREADLIAYKKPLYQVLSLDPVSESFAGLGERSARPRSVAQILRSALESGGEA
ncbi:MAG TPA: hypothetical protein EYQ01_10410 [Nitrospira sp.]|nr:hypothetical protein [Candidatus Manganitrophaceae bacterium]